MAEVQTWSLVNLSSNFKSRINPFIYVGNLCDSHLQASNWESFCLDQGSCQWHSTEIRSTSGVSVGPFTLLVHPLLHIYNNLYLTHSLNLYFSHHSLTTFTVRFYTHYLCHRPSHHQTEHKQRSKTAWLWPLYWKRLSVLLLIIMKEKQIRPCWNHVLFEGFRWISLQQVGPRLTQHRNNIIKTTQRYANH